MGKTSSLLLILLVGCSDKREHREQEPPELVEPDAGHVEVDASPESEIRSLVVELLTQYDRAVETSCACLARAGEVTSLEECIGAQDPARRWTECAVRGLKPLDSAEVRSQVRCQAEQLRVTNDCVEALPCVENEVLQCSLNDVGCPLLDARITDAFAAHCSDDLPPFL